MTFLEKFDELIAGKTAGKWYPRHRSWKHNESSPLYDPDEPEGAEALGPYHPSVHDDYRVAQDAVFIAFVGTHAELIRDALIRARNLHLEVIGSLYELQNHGNLCITNSNVLSHAADKTHEAFKALDEAVK